MKKTYKKLNQKEVNELYEAGPKKVGSVINNLIDIIIQQQAYIDKLEKKVNRLEVRVNELEERVNKNSKNSSKPPSTDGFKKPKSLRKKSSNPNGGQKGHKGHTLYQIDNPNKIVKHEVSNCNKCGHSIKDITSSNIEKRQVYDVEINVVVTEHQAEQKVCPHCGENNKAKFPDDIKNPVQYGGFFKSIGTYLNQYQLLPLERTCEFFEDIIGIRPSESTIVNFNNKMYENLESVEKEIKKQIINSPVTNFDETSTPVNSKNHWLHSASTNELTHFAIHPKRGKKAMDDINILPQFEGVAVHDCWSSYFKFDNCLHSLCNAHLLRELTGIYENDNSQKWALDMILLLCEIKDTVNESKENTNRTGLTSLQIEFFTGIYQQTLDRGFKLNKILDKKKYPNNKPGRIKQSKAKNLLDRLEKYSFDITRFMTDFDVPFDNLAERDIRMTKVKEKISGTFRSQKGADVFARIRCYISTARKNGQSIIKVIKDAFKNKPYLPEKLDTS